MYGNIKRYFAYSCKHKEIYREYVWKNKNMYGNTKTYKE